MVLRPSDQTAQIGKIGKGILDKAEGGGRDILPGQRWSILGISLFQRLEMVERHKWMNAFAEQQPIGPKPPGRKARQTPTAGGAR